MTITISSVISDIKRHLSLMGKRLYSKDGKNMFSDITTSSLEDPIFVHYIGIAARNIHATFGNFVSSFSFTDTNVTLTLAITRREGDFDSKLEGFIKSYLTFFSIGEYLAATHPDLAKKYQDDADNTLQETIVFIFYKKPPTASTASYGKKWYNDRGTALGYTSCTDVEENRPKVNGATYLCYDGGKNYMLTYNETDDEWVGTYAAIDECYICSSDNHRYMATENGWKNLGEA